MKKRHRNLQKSFFEQFAKEDIWALWNQCDTLLELPKKLGFSGNDLGREDYDSIEYSKSREVWQGIIRENRQKEKQRPDFVKNLSKSELQQVMDSPGIETVKHLALHYLMSEKHGRKIIKKQVEALKLTVKPKLSKGIFGFTSTPSHWPTRFWVKRKGPKPTTCPKCSFQATNPLQIEIHHKDTANNGPKHARNPIYFRSPQVEVMCRNCHSLEHRRGEALIAKCGIWRPKPPGTQRYKNPNDIFSSNCQENYRMQKNYYLKWILKTKTDYKCQSCNVITWGKANKVLSLELHHKDGNHKNSLLTNLQLLCPNCHRAV